MCGGGGEMGWEWVEGGRGRVLSDARISNGDDFVR